MKTLKLVFILICVVLFTSLLQGQIEEGKYVIGDQVSLHSKILDQDRNLLISLPLGYDTSEAEYPVIYILDGGYHFHHATGIVQYLSGLTMMPQSIVVAIQNIDRNKDFLPTNVEFNPTSGGAADFLGFISSELIPFINEEYRTAPYNILVGHSYGGTFTAFTFLEKPELFNAYIAISPVMHWDNDLLITKAETALKEKYDKNIYYYMTVGNEPPYLPAIGKFVALIDQRKPKNLEFSYVHMPQENHGTIPHKTIYDGLEKLFKGWGLDNDIFLQGLAAIDDHYNKLSEKFGYPIETQEVTINMLGYNYLMNDKIIEAIEVFAENVIRNPDSANVYDSLGEAYEKNEQYKKAKENYAKACELAEDNNPNKAIFETNLKRMKEKLK